MNTKEALRNRIIRYANYVWHTNTHDLHPFVQLMIEEVCNELSLLDSKLEDVNVSVLNKLVKNLSPSYNYIRPGHAILQLIPEDSRSLLDRKTEFFVKNISSSFYDKHTASVIFTPVTDIKLHSARIDKFFFNNTLWDVDSAGNKSVFVNTAKRAGFNVIWLGLEIHEEIKKMEDLFFYFNFPHLDDNHEYYDIMEDIKWYAGDKPLKTQTGFPLAKDISPIKAEKEVLDFYGSHFQTIKESVRTDRLPKQQLPEELVEIIDKDTASSLPHLYWFSIVFPPYFSQTDMENLTVTLNAFPVMSRSYNRQTVNKKDITHIISLSSGIGEEFLELDEITGIKTYTLDPVKKKEMEESLISDYLEQLTDVVRDERTAFPEIDNEKITDAYNAVSSIRNKDTLKVELNRLNENAEVARLSVNPEENKHDISIHWWTTHADYANGIPAKTTLMAHKHPELNKTDAVLLTSVIGGKSFYDLESLKAINRFCLTAKDRILTKNDIMNFCRIELGRYVREIQVVRNVRISPKFKEGMINVIEIRVTALREQVDYINKSGLFKDLRIRLKQRSPDNFKYKIVFNSTLPD